MFCPDVPNIAPCMCSCHSGIILGALFLHICFTLILNLALYLIEHKMWNKVKMANAIKHLGVRVACD